MKTIRVIFILAVAVVACAFSGALKADTYVYQGNSFTNFEGDAACPGSCEITGTMTADLGDDLSFGNPIDPTSYSFTDGSTILDDTNSTIYAIFSTDDSGTITGWDVYIVQNTDGPDYPDAMITCYNCSADGSFTDSGNGLAYNEDPGCWVDTTPEPSSLALLGTGLLGLMGLTRRKLRA